MSSSGKLWTVGIVCAALGLIVGGGATLVVQQQKTAAMQAQLAVATTARLSAEQKAADTQKALDSVARAASTSPQTSSSSAVVTTTVPAKPAKPKTVRQYAFVKKLTKSGSAWTMTADYAEFLTGTAAAKAAKAHHSESPPPNDYFIVNDNSLLRKLPVKSSAPVKLNDKADGTSDPSGYTTTVADFASLLTGPQGDRFRAVGYWLTITDGTITAIEEQWVP